MTTNFHQEQLPCGCLPGYHRCPVAEEILQRKEAVYRRNKGKRPDDPSWQEYHDLNDVYLMHVKLEPVARLIA